MAPTFYRCYVTRTGPSEDGIINVGLKAAKGEFGDTWFKCNPGMGKEVLDVALMAIKTGKSVDALLVSTTEYSQLQRLYLIA